MSNEQLVLNRTDRDPAAINAFGCGAPVVALYPLQRDYVAAEVAVWRRRVLQPGQVDGAETLLDMAKNICRDYSEAKVSTSKFMAQEPALENREIFCGAQNTPNRKFRTGGNSE